MKSSMENLKEIFENYSSFKEEELFGRYITYAHIENLLIRLGSSFEVTTIGHSNNAIPIRSIKIGKGATKVLMWSQMHGNESTTTKAIFDLLNVFLEASNASFINSILENGTILIIPMLNPDGAEAYTRLNANGVDLNRDAKDLKEVESVLLRQVFDSFKPDFCFNLHDQRTIFGAGAKSVPATISFLTPSMDEQRSIKPSRIISMKLIVAIFKDLEEYLIEGIGRYDDAYNENCTGDTFQGLKVPTILFEAGHYPLDYNREETRKFIFYAILSGLNSIVSKSYEAIEFQEYFRIPQNEKNFYDVILRNAVINDKVQDVAIQFNEVVLDGKINFEPVIVKMKFNINEYAHKEIDCKNYKVTTVEKEELAENVIVDKIAIKNEILVINYENN